MAKDVAAVKRLLKKYRLERHSELVLSALEPAFHIDLRPQRTRSVPIGRSKFGGLPHLPEDATWPVQHEIGRPLQFLAQFNMEEIPHDPKMPTSLPKDGWLYLWCDELSCWASLNVRDEDEGEYPYGVATYVASGSASLVRTPFPDFEEPDLSESQKLPDYYPPDFRPYNERRIVFRPVMSMDKDSLALLHDRSDNLADENAAEDEWERGFEFVADMHGCRDRKGKSITDHRLLGSLHEMMGADMREEAYSLYAQRPGSRAKESSRSGGRAKKSSWPGGIEPRSRQRKDWVMLAMLRSDDRLKFRPDDAHGWLWNDAGALCFWIRQNELEKGDFSRVVGVIGNSG